MLKPRNWIIFIDKCMKLYYKELKYMFNLFFGNYNENKTQTERKRKIL